MWNLTGGEVFATDPTNASRTMLFDIVERRWDPELCDLLHVPMSALPEVRPSSGRFGVTSDRCAVVPAASRSAAIAGDQQAALFGQACFEPGMAKNTYGTGSFVLLNVGDRCPPPTEGMLTTIAWELADGTVAYALEGAIFVTGAAIQWLRDGLGIIDDAPQAGPLAASVPDTGGVYVVPAFTGLGSPWWDPYARGADLGITRGTTRAHLTRAVIESMAYQTRDVVDAMVDASGTPITRPPRRRRRVGDGPACCRSRPISSACRSGDRSTARPPPSARRSSPGSPKGCGPTSTSIAARWQLDATFTPGRRPHGRRPRPRPMAAGRRAFTRLGTRSRASPSRSSASASLREQRDARAFTLADRSIRPAGRHGHARSRQVRPHQIARGRRWTSRRCWLPARNASSHLSSGGCPCECTTTPSRMTAAQSASATRATAAHRTANRSAASASASSAPTPAPSGQDRRGHPRSAARARRTRRRPRSPR